MRGRFIAIEGIDGSGKSTLAARLAQDLSRAGHPVLRTREPGGTPIGEKVRALLLDVKNAEMVPLAEFFLYMASRAQLVEESIRPALRAGQVVICDRYYYSTAAYQGAAGNVGVDAVLDISEKVARFAKPDLVALLDLPPKVARARQGIRDDRVESKGSAYQERVRRGFLVIARRDRRRFRVFDA
ncbi:MAG TPA: dTMP kinase, partial [Planctomycetota bacterium]|nr:dTMP kinase [Planctomycetota bacterium]